MLPVKHYARLIIDTYTDTQPDGYKVLLNLPDEVGWILESEATKEVVLIIKGTTTFKEIMTDIDVWLVPTPFGHLHRGFYHFFRNIYPPIYRFLLNLPSDTELILAGHSLGAAINSIIAVASPLKAKAIISFASPMVGAKDFKYRYRYIHEKTLRYVNEWDIIPKTPLIFTYHHVCHPITFVDGGAEEVFHNHKMSTYAINC